MPFDNGTIASATTGTFIGSVFSDTFTISPNEVDIVALNLTLGNAYAFDIDNDNGSSGDLYIRIFDIFGNEVRANDDGDRVDDNVASSVSPWFHFMPNFTGTYYVAVSPYYLTGYDPFTTSNRNIPENPISTTAGTLTVTIAETNLWPSEEDITGLLTEGAFDDTDVLREEDGSLRVAYNGTVNNPGDVDIGRFDMAKGDVLVFDVNGLAANGTVLRIFNSAGTVLGVDDDNGTGEDPELTFVLPFNLSIFVGISGDGNNTYNAVTGASTLAGATGDFEVIIHKNPTQIGSSSFNSFIGSVGANYIVALAGNDTAFGNGGDDTLAGGDDQDSLRGGNGSDYLYGEHGNDSMFGDADNDVLIGGLGRDQINGGSGFDLLDGGSGDDTLIGGADASADTLNGGTGNDRLLGRSGNDRINGDDGDDSAVGDQGNDTVRGGLGDDALQGADDDDLVDGGDGNDIVYGGNGNDLVFGGADADVVWGNAGSDTLTGGAGNDTLRGSFQADTFVFTSTDISEGVDVIEDFQAASDLIDLSVIFAEFGSIVNAGNLSQFVQCTPAGITDTFVGVDADGLTGGLNFVIIAQVLNKTPTQMFDIDNYLV
jgi:Ca2+-binding RTX toxin-like protein